MKRTNSFDVKLACFFEKKLHLRAVLADYAKVVSSCFACPIFLDVERTKLAKAVRREERLADCVVSHHNFRPVHHRCRDEHEHVFAEREHVSVPDDYASVREVRAEEVLHHLKRLCRCHNRRAFINLQEVCNVGGMVRLHVLNDEIIRLAISKCLFDVVEPLVRKPCFDRVDDGNLFVKYDVRIVCHAVRHVVHAFKKVYLMVVYTDVFDVAHIFHNLFSLLFVFAKTAFYPVILRG